MPSFAQSQYLQSSQTITSTVTVTTTTITTTKTIAINSTTASPLLLTQALESERHALVLANPLRSRTENAVAAEQVGTEVVHDDSSRLVEAEAEDEEEFCSGNCWCDYQCDCPDDYHIACETCAAADPEDDSAQAEEPETQDDCLGGSCWCEAPCDCPNHCPCEECEEPFWEDPSEAEEEQAAAAATTTTEEAAAEAEADVMPHMSPLSPDTPPQIIAEAGQPVLTRHVQQQMLPTDSMNQAFRSRNLSIADSDCSISDVGVPDCDAMEVDGPEYKPPGFSLPYLSLQMSEVFERIWNSNPHARTQQQHDQLRWYMEQVMASAQSQGTDFLTAWRGMHPVC